MFSARLPDHLLQAGTLLAEAAAFDTLVDNNKPLKTILARLHTDKLDMTSALNTSPTGAWECSAHHSPSDSLIRFGDILKGRTAIAMNTLWDAFLAWKDAEEATIAAIKVLCCTVDVALKGVARQANYLANLFRHSSPSVAITDELQPPPPKSPS